MYIIMLNKTVAKIERKIMEKYRICILLLFVDCLHA